MMSLTNSTVSGRRPSLYAPSPRKVVTSNGVLVHQHGDRPVLDAGRHDAREDLLDLLGLRVRGDVPVGGLFSEQQVAHAPADDVRLVAVRLQLLADCTHFVGDAVEQRRHGIESIVSFSAEKALSSDEVWSSKASSRSAGTG